MFNVLVQLVTRQPIGHARFRQTTTVALQEVGDILECTARERTVAGVINEMCVPTPVHAFIRCHTQIGDLWKRDIYWD